MKLRPEPDYTIKYYPCVITIIVNPTLNGYCRILSTDGYVDSKVKHIFS